MFYSHKITFSNLDGQLLYMIHDEPPGRFKTSSILMTPCSFKCI